MWFGSLDQCGGDAAIPAPVKARWSEQPGSGVCRGRSAVGSARHKTASPEGASRPLCSQEMWLPEHGRQLPVGAPTQPSLLASGPRLSWQASPAGHSRGSRAEWSGVEPVSCVRFSQTPGGSPAVRVSYWLCLDRMAGCGVCSGARPKAVGQIMATRAVSIFLSVL